MSTLAAVVVEQIIRPVVPEVEQVDPALLLLIMLTQCQYLI
jgi:hypothetical protein